MKRRFLTLICLVVAMVLAFASCEGEGAATGAGSTCNHTFSEVWQSNETQHWHQATCEHGEQKGSLGDHVDADEDGICDECEYAVGHTHSFSELWSSDVTHHWHAATCTHTNERGDISQHYDMNPTDGKCDTCGDLIKEVDENSVPANITAALAGKSSIVGGSVSYSFVGGTSDDHSFEYLFGTNGTYTKNTDVDGSDGSDSKTYIVENYIKKLSDTEVSGVSITTVDGVSTFAAPSFNINHLEGYLFSVSSIAVKYGAENTLAALYELGLTSGVTDFTESISTADKKAAFSYNLLKVNKMLTSVRDNSGVPTGEKVYVYNVHYYEVSVEFTYSDNHALTSMNIVCSVYTNDAGATADGTPFPTSITYNIADGTITKNPDVAPSVYTFEVEQTVGTRTEIDLSAGDASKPTSVEFYSDEACTLKVDSIVIKNGETKLLYVNTDPKGTFDMLALSPTKNITNPDGTTREFGFCMFHGNQVTFNHNANLPSGVYTCEFIWTQNGESITKNFTVTIVDTDIDGENKLGANSATAGWSDAYVTVNMDSSGVYTFYLPEGVELAKWGDLEDGAPAAADLAFFELVETRADGVTVVKATLDTTNFPYYQAKIRIKLPTADETYIIGYDSPSN